MSKAPPLIFEELQDSSNLIYLTLIEFKKVKYLTIVENVIEDEVQAYILDNLAAEGIDQDWFLSVATRWYYSASDRYPLSFEFAKMGAGDAVKNILKTYNINSISRVIGKLFVFPINAKPKVKRRKVNVIPEAIEVKFRKSAPA